MQSFWGPVCEQLTRSPGRASPSEGGEGGGIFKGRLLPPSRRDCGLGTSVEKLTVNVIFDCGGGLEGDFVMENPFVLFCSLYCHYGGLVRSGCGNRGLVADAHQTGSGLHPVEGRFWGA